MKRVRKITTKIIKMTYSMFLIFALLLTSIYIPPIVDVSADTNNTRLSIQSTNTVSIDETDTYKLIYKIGEIIVGSVKVKLGNDYLTPTMNGSVPEYLLEQYDDEPYQVTAEVTEEDGYKTQDSYFYKGESSLFPGDKKVGLDISSNAIHTFDFSFVEDNGMPNQPPSGPMVMYPIVAYFEGIENGVNMSEEGNIVIPRNWTSGNVSFKAKACKADNGITIPNDGSNICANETEEEIELSIEGIANASQINHTVTGNPNRKSVQITEEFMDYGKLTLHIVSDLSNIVNSLLTIVSENLITVRATAPLAMSQSFGTVAVNQAIITEDITQDLIIFFGNSETRLFVNGFYVDKITAVNSDECTVSLNNDGSATLGLPNLSEETTTQVVLSILLKDGTTITRTINIKRTAFMLDYDSRDGSFKAGYVVNKGYLYNNQDHNDEIFDAYLQVILYKGNVVSGFKQVKIDDEELINGLENDSSGSLELYSPQQIILYDKVPEGITGASVFLTNGPISYDSDTLPSIEFGIGAGVTITWEE